MAFDVLLKKHFTLLVLVLIGVAAYFQARGIGALAGASLEGPAPAASLSTASPAPAQLSGAASKSGAAILSRNPFDSVTGPLEPETAPSGLPAATVGVTDPLQAPPCAGVHVHIVTQAEDPAWSRAALQRDGDDKPQVYRVGDTIGDEKIVYIGENPRARSPAVWLESGSSLCQALLFTDKSAPASSSAPPPAARRTLPAPVSTPTVRRPKRKRLPALDPRLASRIRRLSDTQVRVAPAAVGDILRHPDQLMPHTDVLPESENGKVKGIRIFGIRPNTLLGRFGLISGDRVESVGGVKVTSPDKAIEGYDRMRGAHSLDIKINRGGQPITLKLEIH